MATTDCSRPVCKLIGTDGNVYSLISRVSQALKRDGQPDRAEEWVDSALACQSYSEVLRLLYDYVEPC